MIKRSLLKGFDEQRLRSMLAVFFFALAIPTAVLIWQAYSQLKWESFHQYRNTAEALSTRVDGALNAIVYEADARGYADYGFLVFTGDPNAKFVQRSPLSVYPVEDDLPGVVGYFQVDSDGDFSTPLLPPDGTDAAILGITDEEMTARRSLAGEIQQILADNQLVRGHPALAMKRGLASETVPAESLEESVEEEKEEAPDSVERLRSEITVYSADRAYAPAPATVEQAMEGGFEDVPGTDKDDVDGLIDVGAKPESQAETSYTQSVFDELGLQKSQPAPATEATADFSSQNLPGDAVPAEPRKNTIGKLSDIKLDDQLQRRSEDTERDAVSPAAEAPGVRFDMPARAKRREQTALPEPEAPSSRQTSPALNVAADLRIDTFESEVDPFEFSLLDSGHFVIFRKVWRDGERYIQGSLIDQDTFISQTMTAAFRGTVLFDMSNMIVAYQDDVIQMANGGASYQLGSSSGLDGTLLYRSSLSAPFNSLELIFSVRNLPAGPGASVLGWVTFVLAVVFVGGFVSLYRLGQSQIRLARQQQDFVSAVSHELKTPLTSIRMYGEMLKEGWADDKKRQDYYEFIHDESERLTRMISNVLQLASITRSEPQFEARAVQVGELMATIESKIGGQVDRAGFRLNFQRDRLADEKLIVVDDDCFAQIVINLVDNAIKFSRKAEIQSIDISSRLQNDGNIAFRIRDYGPGIAPDQMKKIFELFYRTESELTRETVGTGIGLAIVHQLATAMGGNVDVVNRDPGAEFCISFPALSA